MISKTGLHAIRALTTLAELPAGKFAGAGDVAGEIDAPQNYLGKLLQTLARAGLVVSQKGMGGGFRLAKPASEICLFDVVNPFEHLDRWTGCVLSRKGCSDSNPCVIHHQWDAVRSAYIRLLRTTNLLDLISDTVSKQAG